MAANNSKTYVENKTGCVILFDYAVEMMDEEIREALHESIAPCTEQEFFDAYESAHAEKFGEEWELRKENPTF